MNKYLKYNNHVNKVITVTVYIYIFDSVSSVFIYPKFLYIHYCFTFSF